MITMSAQSILKIETNYNLVQDICEVSIICGNRAKFEPNYPYATGEALMRLYFDSSDSAEVAKMLREVADLADKFTAREKENEEICEGDHHSTKCFTGELEGTCPIFEAERKDAEELSLT